MILYILIVTFALVFVGFYLKRFLRRKNLRKRVMADGSNDYSKTAKNIAQSIANSRSLYKELIGKTHPDRFVNDPQKQKKAAEIASLITASKRNYNELIVLKERINDEL